MTWSYRGYDKDSKGATAPILQRLLHWIQGQDPGGKSLGTYAHRPVRGGTTPSVHQAGRALDWEPSSKAAGDRLWQLLTGYPDGAAVQYVIWQRQSWGGSPGPVIRAYHGVDPHTSHLHIETRGWA